MNLKTFNETSYVDDIMHKQTHANVIVNVNFDGNTQYKQVWAHVSASPSATLYVSLYVSVSTSVIGSFSCICNKSFQCKRQ